MSGVFREDGLAADTADVLAADTTDVLSAAKAAAGGFCPAQTMLAKTGDCPKQGLGHDGASRGSKSSFDRLPRQGIARRS